MRAINYKPALFKIPNTVNSITNRISLMKDYAKECDRQNLLLVYREALAMLEQNYESLLFDMDKKELFGSGSD